MLALWQKENKETLSLESPNSDDFLKKMCVFFYEIIQTDIINTNLPTIQIKKGIKYKRSASGFPTALYPLPNYLPPWNFCSGTNVAHLMAFWEMFFIVIFFSLCKLLLLWNQYSPSYLRIYVNLHVQLTKGLKIGSCYKYEYKI